MQRALFLTALSFFGGVALRSIYDIDVYTIGALLAGIGGTVLVGKTYGFHGSGMLVLVICGLVLGIVRTEFADRSFEHGLVLEEGSVYAGTGTVVREPDVRDELTLLTVALDMDSGANTRVLVRVPHAPAHTYGDRVSVRGTVRRPEAFVTDTGRIFAYPEYLMKDGIHYELSRVEAFSIDGIGGHRITRALLAVKQNWLQSVARAFPEPSASLLAGIVVGAKQSLGSMWLDAFRETGLVHIVVLSGYNLTIVALFIVWITALLPRPLQLTLGLAGIIGFALMTGAGATVVRASIMASLALIAHFFARPYAIMRALVLAGFIMVLSNPFLLLHDPGFQLSFIATVGLVLGSPLVERKITFVPSLFGIRTIVSATLATQIAVLPLLLFLIGEVSLVAPLVNVLVLPVIPLLMGIGFAAGALGILTQTIAAPLALIAHGILAYIFFIVETFSALQFSAVELPPIPLWSVALLYVLGITGAIRALHRIESKERVGIPTPPLQNVLLKRPN